MLKLLPFLLLFGLTSCLTNEYAYNEYERYQLEQELNNALNEMDAEIVEAPADAEEEIVEVVEVEEIAYETKEEEIFTVVEKMPQFPGGEEEMYTYLAENISYPELAREENVQGTVYAQFVVEKDGLISNVDVLRGIGSGCDIETKRVILNMPKWEPGEQRGKKVRVKYTLPVRFKLADEKSEEDE